MSNRLLQFYPSATPSFFLVTTHSETWKNFIIRISIPLPFPTDEIILSVGNFFALASFSATTRGSADAISGFGRLQELFFVGKDEELWIK